MSLARDRIQQAIEAARSYLRPSRFRCRPNFEGARRNFEHARALAACAERYEIDALYDLIGEAEREMALQERVRP